MINFKLKLFLFVFLFLIVFFITSLFVSLSFIEVPEKADSLDAQDMLDLNDAGDRFQRITPNIEPTKLMIKVPLVRRLHEKYNNKGGWFLNIFQSKKYIENLLGDEEIPVFRKRIKKKLDDVKHKEKRSFNYDTPVFRKRKLLSAVRQKSKESKKGKVIRNQKKPILVGQQYENEEYENNYEDNFDSGVPDLAKQAQNTQDAITYFLIGSFAFFALLFMFVFPVASFMRMCLKNYDSNLLIVSDVLCCRDPKYRLVKEMCDKCEIPIPDYSLYRKLMKYYEAKDAETAVKERLLKETTTDESDNF